MEEQLSNEQRLELITKMINEGKNYYYESGFGSLLWGFTNMIAFTLAYLDQTIEGFDLPVTPFVLLLVALAIQIYNDRKERAKRQALTYTEEALGYVWITFGIAVGVFTIVGAIANIGYVTLPVLLLLFGMPTFTTGCISKFKSMIIGGIVCWVFAIIAFLYQGYHAYLLCAGGAIAAWVIPGFILKAEFNKSIREAKKQ